MTAARRDVPLTLSAVLGAVVAAAVVVLALTDTRPVAFRSGSMSPAIPTGAVALVQRVPAEELRVGDVVTVPVGETHVTHRVVRLTSGDGLATLQLRGDANAAADPGVHRVSSAERVVGSLPWVGYLLGGLSGPAGWLLVGGYVLWLLRRLVRGDAVDGPAPAPARHRRGRGAWGGPLRPPAASGVVLAAGVLSGVVLAVGVAPRAFAAWTDGAAVTGTQLGTRTVPPPATFSCGGLGLLGVEFSWAAVAGATSYRLHYGQGGSETRTVTTTSTRVSALVSGGTAWVQANVPYGTTHWTSAPSPTRAYTVAAVGVCG